MFIGEPPATPADLHFRLLGVPVRVHPWFWVITLIFGLGPSSGEKAVPIEVAIWMVVVFVSVLIHEMGHAFMQRRFGGHPWITLYSFGGLSSCDDCDRSPRSQILISLAGPAAGFLFAALVLLLVRATGHPVFAATDTAIEEMLSKFQGGIWFFYLGWKRFGIAGIESARLGYLLAQLLFVNIWWGLINLLPIYPLDGGRVSRELFTLGANPRWGIVASLWLSVATAALMVLYGLSRNSIYLALLFGLLGYGSYQSLRAYQNHYS